MQGVGCPLLLVLLLPSFCLLWGLCVGFWVSLCWRWGWGVWLRLGVDEALPSLWFFSLFLSASCLRVVHLSVQYSSQYKNNHFTEMCSGSEEGSYFRIIDFCITQL